MLRIVFTRNVSCTYFLLSCVIQRPVKQEQGLVYQRFATVVDKCKGVDVYQMKEVYA